MLNSNLIDIVEDVITAVAVVDADTAERHLQDIVGQAAYGLAREWAFQEIIAPNAVPLFSSEARNTALIGWAAPQLPESVVAAVVANQVAKSIANLVDNEKKVQGPSISPATASGTDIAKSIAMLDNGGLGVSQVAIENALKRRAQKRDQRNSKTAEALQEAMPSYVQRACNSSYREKDGACAVKDALLYCEARWTFLMTYTLPEDGAYCVELANHLRAGRPVAAGKVSRGLAQRDANKAAVAVLETWIKELGGEDQADFEPLAAAQALARLEGDQAEIARRTKDMA